MEQRIQPSVIAWKHFHKSIDLYRPSFTYLRELALLYPSARQTCACGFDRGHLQRRARSRRSTDPRDPGHLPGGPGQPELHAQTKWREALPQPGETSRCLQTPVRVSGTLADAGMRRQDPGWTDRSTRKLEGVWTREMRRRTKVRLQRSSCHCPTR